MEFDIGAAVDHLTAADNKAAYAALRQLRQESEASDRVYPYWDRFAAMLDSDNSYVRTRGLTLLACNARWDRTGRMDGLMDRFLTHIHDPKPVTARQCIQLLPMVAAHQPALREKILAALRRADPSGYPDSMQKLVLRDILEAQTALQP